MATGGGLLCGLLLCEVALRVADIRPQIPISKRRLIVPDNPKIAFHCYSSNPNGELEALPDLDHGLWKLTTYTFEPDDLPLGQATETPWCVRYDFSSQGFRDREYIEPPADGVLRIAVIGDSFVFGEGVSEGLTLSRQISRLLGDNTEVLNAGMVGANMPQERRTLERVLEKNHSRRILFVFIPNDIPLTVALEQRQDYINDLVVMRDTHLTDHQNNAWYAGHLRTLHFAGLFLAMRRIQYETIQWYRDSYNPDFNGRNMKAFEQDIRSLASIPNCQVAFVLYPLMIGFESGYPLSSIHEYVVQIAETAGIPVLDLAEAFAGQKTESLWVHPTDHHPNGVAHAIAAERIVHWLNSEVPQFLESGSSDHGSAE
ncbi:MAG: SGNH/GDSL hydrolase family protein [Planctomycetaceae bacterium]